MIKYQCAVFQFPFIYLDAPAFIKISLSLSLFGWTCVCVCVCARFFRIPFPFLLFCRGAFCFIWNMQISSVRHFLFFFSLLPLWLCDELVLLNVRFANLVQLVNVDVICIYKLIGFGKFAVARNVSYYRRAARYSCECSVHSFRLFWLYFEPNNLIRGGFLSHRARCHPYESWYHSFLCLHSLIPLRLAFFFSPSLLFICTFFFSQCNETNFQCGGTSFTHVLITFSIGMRTK